MPLDRLQKEGLSSFLGVNLRRDGLTLAEGEMARVLNADLQTRPGALLRRRGQTPRDATAYGAAIRTIARHNGFLYAVAGGDWFRDGVSILSGLSAPIQTMAPYQVLNAPVSSTYLASEQGMHRDTGLSRVPWGVRAPTNAPSVAAGAAGVLTGRYRAGYTYAYVDVDGLVVESNMSLQSDPVVTLSNEQLAITVAATGQTNVTNIRLYRTLESGSVFFFDQQVANTSGTYASTAADTALGALLEDGHNPPPRSGWVAEFQGAFFLCRDPVHPDYLWYSRRFEVEYWPPENFLKVGSPSDPLLCAVPQVGFLGLFTALTKYRVFGNHSSGFAWLEALNTRGTCAPQAVLATSRGTLFWAKDGIWATNFVAADQELSVAWAPLFDHQRLNDYAPIDWTKADTFTLAEYKRRLYCGYVDVDGQTLMAVYSQETSQWYHYLQPQARTLYYDEAFEQLLAGGTGGVISVLEEGTDDAGQAIAMEATLATRSGGDRFVQKRFEYIRFDLHAYTTTTAKVFIDDVLEYTLTITDARNRRLLRLPPDLLGYTWTVRMTGAFDLFAVLMAYAPLEDS